MIRRGRGGSYFTISCNEYSAVSLLQTSQERRPLLQLQFIKFAPGESKSKTYIPKDANNHKTVREVHHNVLHVIKVSFNVILSFFQGAREHRFQCQDCGATYRWKKSLNSHIRAKHNQVKHVCSKCSRSFQYAHDKARHEKTCCGQRIHTCPQCNKRCSTAHGLRRHLQWHDKAHQANESLEVSPLKAKDRTRRFPASTVRPTPPIVKTALRPRPLQFRCRRCTEVFTNRHDLYLHGRQQHYNQMGGALHPLPWGRDEQLPWDGDNALQEVYEANSSHILDNHHLGPIHSVYNFPLTNDVDLNQLVRMGEDIYRQQQRAFRLNLVFGTILQNRVTGRYRYFVPYNNNGIFERPLYISRRADLRRLRRELERKDILTELLRNRPDTQWIPVLVTNVHFVVTETHYPIGQGLLPEYLLKKDSLYPLIKNQHSGKLYKDNLCAFRCLALHLGYEIRCIDGPANQLFRQWSDLSKEEFEGLTFEDFPQFETRFTVNLEVYSLAEDGYAHSIYKSRGLQSSTMYVNLYENHMSFIRDFSMYAQKYQCKTCQRHFGHAGHLHRHQKICLNKTKFVYPGGFHQAKESIFDQLDQFEIRVPEKERTFPWFVCYDFEALLQKIQEQPTDMLQWTHKHMPVSVSICSNVEGYLDPVCLVDGDQDKLVQSMVSVMNQIALRVNELAKEKWDWVLEAIDAKLNESSEDTEVDSSSEDELCDETHQDDSQTKKSSHPLQKIYGNMETYMAQVPVIGFNSAKYDVNLIKRCLAKHLNMHEDSSAFVVKKNNSYTCISTESLKFLDMTQFLAPGSSYSGFLKAYHVEQQKGYFPYEWFDNISKLEATSLPPHEAFYSQLKSSNISQEAYIDCQQAWNDQQMKTFKDFLIWYNNLDVEPFVKAVEKFQQFYFEKGVDVFKTAISVPGIARQLLFKTAQKQNVNFALFDHHNEDLYKTIKQNIVGGPSIIFTRHHCAGKTLIRGKKKCGSVIGFDANALYLDSIGRAMAVGPFVRRLADKGFRPELRDKYMSAYYWMDWYAHTHGVTIQHKLNTGREVRVGKYPVDGFYQPFFPERKPLSSSFMVVFGTAIFVKSHGESIMKSG